MPTKHPRPAHEFNVTSLTLERDIEHNHQRAGFEPIPDEVLVRRFWQFLRFLQQRGLTTRTIASSVSELSDDTGLTKAKMHRLSLRPPVSFGKAKAQTQTALRMGLVNVPSGSNNFLA
jgi:hypothetical protein